MSFDADTLFGEIKKVKKELDILRSQSRQDFSGGGSSGGGGFGVGGTTVTTPSVHATFALHPTIHRLDETDDGQGNNPITYNLELSITLRGASVIVEEGSTHPSSTLEFHTINGTLNDGQILTMKPKEGKTLTLKTGGNIDITADVSVADTEFVILQYFDDNTLANSSPVTGTYSLLSGGGGDNLGDHTATADLNMATFDILQPDRLFWETNVVIQAIDTTPTDGTLDRLEYNAGNLGGHDFFVDRTNTTIPRFGITETSIQSNVPLDMNLNHIIFQSITGVASPTGNEKRFLFSDSANSDNLSVKLPNGTIIDLELAGSTTLDSLTDTTITSVLSSDVLKWDGFAWVNEKIGNNSIMTNAMIEWAKINPAGSKLDDIGDCTIGTTPTSNTVLKEYNGGWVDGNILNVNIDASANIDWTKINKTGSSINDTDDTSIINSANTVIKYDTGLSKWVAGSVQNDQVASNANIDQSKINLSITNSELAGGDYDSITGIGSQTQTLDMNDNMISNITLAGIVDTGGIARGSVSGDSTQGLVINGSLTTLLDVTIPIATFTKNTNNGIDFHANVSMNTNYRITDVEDPVNNQDVVTKAWHNANVSAVAKLDDIGDCTIGTIPTSNTVLKEYNGGWVDGLILNDQIDSSANISKSKISTSSTWATGDIPSLPASQITSGTFSTSRIPSLPASQITSGYIDVDRLGSSSSSSKFLRGDNTWQTVSGGGSWVGSATSTLDMNTYNIEDVDQLVFSIGNSSSDILPNTSYGIEADGGTSPIGMRYNVPLNKEHNFYINGVLEMEINSGGVDFKNNDLEGVDDIEFTTSIQKISSGSNSIDIKVDLNDWISLQVNATEIIRATGSYLYVYKPMTTSGNVTVGGTLYLEDQNTYKANKIYFGSISLNKYIGNSATNDFTMNVPSGGDIKFSENFNNFLVMDGGTNENIFHRRISMDGGNLFRAYDGTECGYHVSNATDLGTKGTMGVPYVSASGAVNDSTLNTYFGSTNGCIGVQYDSSNGYGYFWIKANGDWKKSYFT
jgi:hypothetical protein